jgi:preprotein translocase subunit YajC
MLISTAYAQAAGGGGFLDGGMAGLIPIAGIFIVFYFLLIRPQQKKQKQHQEMLGKVKRGDRVVTGGGIIGTVTDAKDAAELQVEIAPGVRVRVLRATITDVLAKTEPRSGDDDEKADKAEKADKK